MPHRAAAASDDWLVGGGEMAKVIKAMDWSRTPLGAIESWPQSLRTTVSLAQASNSPMSLAWGHIQIYNDGYWPICGTKHPGSMGQDFRECWASAWPVIGEAYASAWAGRSAYLEKMRMFLDRYGFLEETWFTFSFSPITDESGGVGGVFHPVTEMTSQMLSERRTQTLRDLASRTAKARTSEDAFSLVMGVFEQANLDLPFVLLYVLEPALGLARLVGQAGVSPGAAECPEVVDTGAAGTGHWAIGEVARTGVVQHLDDVALRLVSANVGPYPQQPRAARVLPIMLPGGAAPAVVMVAGVSSRLPLDDAYMAFYDLLAAGVAAALAGARAYEEERQKLEALAEIDRAKSAFFANVSHEFRTPLTLILGPIEDALAKGQLSDGAVEMIHRNALRLLRLVNSLLDFSRIEAGSLTSRFEPVDLSALTAALGSSFHSLIVSAGVSLVVDCPPLAEPIYVDPAHWEKVVLNLVSNAFKFTLKGEIAVQLRMLTGCVELTVRDTGTGISADELPRIFERFYRVESASGRTFEGTGIGLALVNELVKAHGGTVRAESRVGHGTTFVVSIPTGSSHLPQEQVALPSDMASARRSKYPALLEAAAWAASTARVSEVAGASARLRILVADDNADMRLYLSKLLSPHWDVELVEDGRAALAAALARPPDLILSDVMMPRMDGVALLRALRDDARTASMTVVLLSARAGQDALLEGLETLADDYLVKPFSARELLARVRTHLRMAEVRQRLQAHLVLADRMAAVGTLAAGVAHEINNPLAYVISNLDLIAEELRTLPGGASTNRMRDMGEMVNEARQGAERVRKIVRGLKTFARADEERRVPLDVKPLLELAVDMAFNEIRHRARIVKDLGAIPPILADEARLGQVFVNLLVNAAHSIPEGNADKNEIGIATRTDSSGRGVIEIRDTGAGIDPHVVKRVFEPFFTTKDISQGTGLGLSICYTIITGLGGEMSVESEPGRGSTFRMVLPPANLELSKPVPKPAPDVPPRTSSGRVLVVDDDVSVGMSLNRILGAQHEVTVLSEGKRALDLLIGGERFDVILCDLMMPIMTGMDLHAALARDLPQLVESLVFVTGGAFSPAAQKFLDSVPNQRIEKPFSPQTIRALVQSAITIKGPAA